MFFLSEKLNRENNSYIKYAEKPRSVHVDSHVDARCAGELHGARTEKRSPYGSTQAIKKGV